MLFWTRLFALVLLLGLTSSPHPVFAEPLPGALPDEEPVETAEPVSSSNSRLRNESPADSSEVPSVSRFSAHYFGIYFGPFLEAASPNFADRPQLDMRHYLTLNYAISDDTRIGVTSGWNWQGIPADTPTPRDPFVKLGRSNIIQSGPFSWYGDFRVHLPVTLESRRRDLWVGLQTFHYLGFEPAGRLGAGLALSARYNQLGGEGWGDDWEFYLGPNVSWALTRNLAVNLLTEWGAGHPFGDTSRTLLSNGLNLEPGFNWEPFDTLWINPYVTIPIDQTARQLLGGMSLGMILGWQAF